MENKERWNKDQTERGHMTKAKLMQHVIPILNAENDKVDKIKPEILTMKSIYTGTQVLLFTKNKCLCAKVLYEFV